MTDETAPYYSISAVVEKGRPCITLKVHGNIEPCNSLLHFLESQRDDFAEMGIPYERNDGRINQVDFFPRTAEGTKELIAKLGDLSKNERIPLRSEGGNDLDINALAQEFAALQSHENIARAISVSRS